MSLNISQNVNTKNSLSQLQWACSFKLKLGLTKIFVVSKFDRIISIYGAERWQN